MKAHIPVLIGCASVTAMPRRGEVLSAPVDLLARAGALALEDTGSKTIGASIDTVVTMRLFSETSPRFRSALGGSANLPRSIAQRIGLPHRREIYARSGGNMPQYAVNRMAGDIARGDATAVLLVGGEALASQRAAEKLLAANAWAEDPGGTPEELGDTRPAYSPHEVHNGVAAAIVGYPLIENAIRTGLGRTIDDHLAAMGALLEPFAAVAKANPLATRRQGFSAAQIATPSPDNAYIGFPYTKLMNSNAYVDQAAALLLTSAEHARAHGIPEDRWIYLHGHADVDDIWHFTERRTLDRSRAIRLGSRHALEMAGLGLDAIESFDIYSCFPSAIEVARDAIGLGVGDPRPLTVTGGLLFHGGPGNSYTMCAIAQMMARLRARPGSYGMVTGNGNVLTKHAFGIYSTTPRSHHEEALNTALQAEVDSEERAVLDTAPHGDGTIETYTVVHAGGVPVDGVALGRMNGDGRRFIARLPKTAEALEPLTRRDAVGMPGRVTTADDGACLFTPLTG